jgi:hypothetical protein
MEVEVAQKYADRPTLWRSLFARMDRSVFQDARFQPAPDQADQARITDSMLDITGRSRATADCGLAGARPPPHIENA